MKELLGTNKWIAMDMDCPLIMSKEEIEMEEYVSNIFSYIKEKMINRTQIPKKYLVLTSMPSLCHEAFLRRRFLGRQHEI